MLKAKISADTISWLSDCTSSSVDLYFLFFSATNVDCVTFCTRKSKTIHSPCCHFPMFPESQSYKHFISRAGEAPGQSAGYPRWGPELCLHLPHKKSDMVAQTGNPGIGRQNQPGPWGLLVDLSLTEKPQILVRNSVSEKYLSLTSCFHTRVLRQCSYTAIRVHLLMYDHARALFKRYI